MILTNKRMDVFTPVILYSYKALFILAMASSLVFPQQMSFEISGSI
jgi:hypothetical protein